MKSCVKKILGRLCFQRERLLPDRRSDLVARCRRWVKLNIDIGCHRVLSHMIDDDGEIFIDLGGPPLKEGYQEMKNPVGHNIYWENS